MPDSLCRQPALPDRQTLRTSGGMRRRRSSGLGLASERAQWMWGDAADSSGILWNPMRNPLRWSRIDAFAGVISDLETQPETSRPVLVKVWTRQNIEQDLRYFSVSDALADLRARSVCVDGDAGSTVLSAASTSLPSRAAADAEVERRRAESGAAAEATEAKAAFRFKDRSKIPDALVQGPFEDFELSGDVYATAYIIARNATEDMYSISPFRNPQVRVVWAYLGFIVFSQLYVIVAISALYPPAGSSKTLHIDCENVTKLASLQAQGLIRFPADAESCREEGTFAFEADVRGVTAAYYQLEVSKPFYETVLIEKGSQICLLRLICSLWVYSQAYFNHFQAVRSVVGYYDFSRWFLPLKGSEVRNQWTIVIPMIQFTILLILTCVSFLVIWAQDEAFDVVMNSLAFTFIFEVGTYFNDPLARKMASTKIAGLDPSWGEINYMYPEYLMSNAITEDGTYTDGGWYILDDEQKAGLLSDYKVRHNPDAYEQSEALVYRLEVLLFICPPALILVFAMRSHGIPGGLYHGLHSGAEL